MEITPLPMLKTEGEAKPEDPTNGGEEDEHGTMQDPEKTFVFLRLAGLMKDAVVSIDGEIHEENPLKLEQSDRPVQLAVSREGKEIYSTTIVPGKDEELNLANLVKVKPKAADKKHSSKPTSKPKDKKSAKDKTADEPGDKPAKKDKAGKKDGAHKIFKDFPD